MKKLQTSDEESGEESSMVPSSYPTVAQRRDAVSLSRQLVFWNAAARPNFELPGAASQYQTRAVHCRRGALEVT